MSINQPHAGSAREAVTGHRMLTLFIGVVLIVLGLAAILGLFVFTTVLTLLLGSVMTLAGLLMGWLALSADASAGDRVVNGLVAIVLFGAGIYLLVNPSAGLVAASILFAVVFPIEGVIKIAAAYDMRGVSNWGWMLVSGLVSIGFAIYVWTTGVLVSSDVLGLIVGLDLIIFGFALLAIASSPIQESAA